MLFRSDRSSGNMFSKTSSPADQVKKLEEQKAEVERQLKILRKQMKVSQSTQVWEIPEGDLPLVYPKPGRSQVWEISHCTRVSTLCMCVGRVSPLLTGVPRVCLRTRRRSGGASRRTSRRRWWWPTTSRWRPRRSCARCGGGCRRSRSTAPSSPPTWSSCRGSAGRSSQRPPLVPHPSPLALSNPPPPPCLPPSQHRAVASLSLSLSLLTHPLCPRACHIPLSV